MTSDTSSAGSDGLEQLCKTCEQNKSDYPGIKYYRCSYDELGQGVSNGCPQCRFVAACVETIKEHLENDEIDRIHFFPWSNEFGVHTRAGVVYLDIFTKERKTGNVHTPFEIRKVHRSLSESTDSATTEETMRGWLSECAEFHTRCRAQREHSEEFRGPLRLLEVSRDPVVLRENMGGVQYACLSHCWGTKHADTITKTTEKTVDKFKNEGIVESILSRNFRDAIKICRALGINHLWIDSLCIIQDREEDWNDQSQQMADIYENAHITIAATRSSDSSGGCYSKRPARYVAKPVIGYEGVFVLVQPPAWPGSRQRSATKMNLPLLDRGWVHQEMRLSRRVLHFCDEQVFWVCRTSTLNESKCAEKVDDYIRKGAEISYTYMVHDLPSENPDLLWYLFVHEISRLQFTFSKDRIAGLAGIARRIQNHHEMGRYLSGLWEKSLVFGLGWRTDHAPGDDSKKGLSNGSAKVPTYPSWSWASVNGPIEWDSDMYWHVPIVEIQQIDFVADGPVHMGGVSKLSVSITVKARALDSSDVHPPATDYDNRPTQVKGVNMMYYRPDRSIEGGQTKMGGLILVISIRSVGNGLASAIHVKLRNDRKTYERVGYVFLDYTSYGKDEGRSHVGEDAIEPWESLPMMEITIV